MIGLVIVSHSEKLADGVVDLARQMGGPDLAIEAAGGTGDAGNPIGTNAMRILEAIKKADSGDGVLVLVDLGSAIMNAEMALDMLDDDLRERIHITSAPLIEGAIVASTQAKAGSPLEAILAEAHEALLPKREQVGDVDPAPADTQPGTNAGDWQTLTLEVPNTLGMHLRPASKLVTLMAAHEVEAQVRNATTGKGPVSANSANRLMMLGAQQGHTLEFEARGPAVDAVFEALRAFAAQNFGDDDAAAPPTPVEAVKQPADGSYRAGLPASQGIAIGPARVYTLKVPTVTRKRVRKTDQQVAKLEAALTQARDEVNDLVATTRARSTGDAGAIFEAHRLLLSDDALLEPAFEDIRQNRYSAAYAWQQAYEAVAATYEELEDAYQRERAQDVRDVGVRVLRHLMSSAISTPELDKPGILVAQDLTPADTAQLDPEFVQGIATAKGAPTSHSAIIANSFGIPAVVGLGDAILDVKDGTPLILDGAGGRLYIEPDDTTRTDYEKRAATEAKAQAKALEASRQPATTTDGHRVEVFANIGSVADAKAAVEAGAEGVGLFRTEFLFLDRKTAPTEDEQFEVYEAVAEALEGRPLIIRTLDVGGDKPLPYIEIGHEDNPFLGWRAIRVSLAQPDLFKAQLRAIVRVAANYPVKVMFPMIATVEEFRQARALLDEATEEAKEAGHDVPDSIEVGTMVEIPALAMLAEAFAEEVDFFSVGTNDLTQYTLAAERGNPRLAALGDAFQPAVLRLIKRVVAAADAAGKWVGVCGALAGHPQAVPLLTGLGIKELSMSAPAIPQAKQIVRGISREKAAEKAAEALRQTSPEAVRALFE